MDWESLISQLFMRFADGVVSDDDVDFLFEQLPTGREQTKEWLQDLVDKVGPDNVQLLMALYMIYQMRKRR